MADVVLWLGGNWKRGYHAAEVAKSLPGSILLISSEGNQKGCFQITDAAQLNRERVIWDDAAWDTVTNFTLTFKRIAALAPRHVVVVTDGFHMRRSMAIGRVVYAGTGIALKPSPSSPAERQEPDKLVQQDVLRALLWRATGFQHIWKEVYERRTGQKAPGLLVRMG